MKVIIINKTNFKNTYICVLNEKYKVNKKILLDKENEIEFDLSTDKFIYYTNGRIKSEIMILSDNLSVVECLYCKKTRKYKFDLKIKEKDSYGRVDTYILKDEKNLYFREDKEKVINVYVPSFYDENKKYKVLLMFDSQNIFDISKVGNYTTKNDPYGSWQVEVSLEYHKYEYIVVGIENADKYREHELSFFYDDIKGMNKLKRFLTNSFHLNDLDNFINETLLPFINERYNVILENLSVAGASCGGAAALYVGLKNNEKYDNIYAFTSATGILSKRCLNQVFAKLVKGKTSLPNICLFQGLNDDLERLLYSGNKYIKELLIKNGYDETKLYEYIESSANHNEDAWRYAFNYYFYLLNK